MSKLTPKQLIFCKEYLVSMNATASCIKAGYSKKTADVQGSRMLANVKIKEYINKLQTKRADRLDITADAVLKEIANIAFFDIRNIFDGNTLKEIDTLEDKTAKAISSIKSRVEKSVDGTFSEIVEIKSNDKLKALDMLSKHLGLYEIDNEQGKTEIQTKRVTIVKRSDRA